MSTPSSHGESSGRKFIAAIRAHEAGGKPGIYFETGAHVRARFYLAQKFVDRARPKRVKGASEAAETKIGEGVAHGRTPIAIARANAASMVRFFRQ
jgi:hypothetical protein